MSLGNRGSDVRALQATLIDKGYPMTFDGIFGTVTRDAVKGFQGTHGLKVTGIVDSLTWNRLLTEVGPGSTGMPVRVLQRQLIEKLGAKVPVDGIYGTSTKAAVIAFQKHMGLNANGVGRAADVALAAVALRAAVVQLDDAVRLQRRQRRWRTGASGRPSASSRHGRDRRGRRATAGSRWATSGSSTAATSRATRPTRSAWTSTSGRSARTSDQCRWGTN